MPALVPRIEFPELFLGLVAPIGVDLEETIRQFKLYFKSNGYNVVEIRVTDTFRAFSQQINPEKELKITPFEERYKSHISYGNQLRRTFGDNSFLAAIAVSEIVRKREELYAAQMTTPEERFSKTVYILRQFKRQEEIDLLRSIYGKTFFQVSVYSRRGARVDYLARKISESRGTAEINRYRSISEELVSIDENESDKNGQKVGKIFHDADLIVNSDVSEFTVAEQVSRFCELLFSSNVISPNHIEYGMFAAKSAALRTLDLSRQVGAAIFSTEGEILSFGSNEVPKAEGGSYWTTSDRIDDRDYKRNKDTNYFRKKEIISELITSLMPHADVEAVFASASVQESQLMDALEYGRVVHAEMAAITDAARLGKALRGATLFCTTFPCHMCAKHIVASGIAKVYFLEPYPKSLSVNLHSDSISFEGEDRGEYQHYPSADFLHFYGITPRRYRELFERNSRKDDDGCLENYIDNQKRPNIDIKTPSYVEHERFVLDGLKTLWQEFIAAT